MPKKHKKGKKRGMSAAWMAHIRSMRGKSKGYKRIKKLNKSLKKYTR